MCRARALVQQNISHSSWAVVIDAVQGGFVRPWRSCSWGSIRSTSAASDLASSRRPNCAKAAANTPWALLKFAIGVV